MKKVLISGIIIVFVIFGLFVVFSNEFTGTSYNTYTNQYMSFQYPDGWNTEDISMGSVNVYEGSKGDMNKQYFTVTPFGKTNGHIFRFIHNFNSENKSVSSNTDPSTIKTGDINGGYYTFYGNHDNKTNTRQFLFFYQNDTGVIVSGYIKDPAILEEVIATFKLK
jgi:hypothetical protein